jgi:hypothetical protein
LLKRAFVPARTTVRFGKSPVTDTKNSHAEDPHKNSTCVLHTCGLSQACGCIFKKKLLSLAVSSAFFKSAFSSTPPLYPSPLEGGFGGVELFGRFRARCVGFFQLPVFPLVGVGQLDELKDWVPGCEGLGSRVRGTSKDQAAGVTGEPSIAFIKPTQEKKEDKKV